MKILLNTIIAGLFALVMTGCSTETGIGDEQTLNVLIDPLPVGAFQRTFGTAYDFNVLLKSIMPARGVDVTVVYRQDIDNQVIFNQQYYITKFPMDVTVTNIPFNEVGTVTVTLTSKADPSNTVTKTFKLVRK